MMLRAGVTALLALAGMLGPDTAFAQLDIVYVNRCDGGCTVTPGLDNAVTGRSTLVTSTRTLPEFPYADGVFHATVECLRAVFARYDILVTATHPGTAPRRELMLAGMPGDIGAQTGINGIAPFNGSPLPNAIAFAFAQQIGEDVEELCYTGAHELAHLYALDHVFECADIMTYLSCAGTKAFTDIDAPCGESAPRTCASGAATQNSHAILAALAGQEDVLFRDGFGAAGPAF
jgi:hypothetical protein